MKILQHLSAIVIISIIMLLFYASIQQVYRSNANDPQTQLIYELKNQLEKGRTILLNSDSIDLEKSLSVFTGTYDINGNPLQSNGYLDGKLPHMPKGVFQNAGYKGENWITWQPKRNVRMAMGIAKVESSPVAYVAAGRSLREVEQRESRLVTMIFLAWILCCCIIAINWFVHFVQYRKAKHLTF